MILVSLIPKSGAGKWVRKYYLFPASCVLSLNQTVVF